MSAVECRGVTLPAFECVRRLLLLDPNNDVGASTRGESTLFLVAVAVAVVFCVVATACFVWVFRGE